MPYLLPLPFVLVGATSNHYWKPNFPCVSWNFFDGTTKSHRKILISLSVTHRKIAISLSVFIELTGKIVISLSVYVQLTGKLRHLELGEEHKYGSSFSFEFRIKVCNWYLSLIRTPNLIILFATFF